MPEYIAPYILREEYACKCCGKLPPELYDSKHFFTIPYKILFEIFKKLRVWHGKPLRIDSGYRCPEHNKAIGGELMSAHLFGLALDMKVGSDQELEMLQAQIEKNFSKVRMGVYKKKLFIHLDVAFLVYPRPVPQYVEGARWER